MTNLPRLNLSQIQYKVKQKSKKMLSTSNEVDDLKNLFKKFPYRPDFPPERAFF